MDKFPSTLLVTSTGLVGGNILSILKNKSRSVLQTYYPAVDKPEGLPVDITDKSSVDQLFEKTKTELVILSAALTNVELCEEKREVAWNINVTGAQNVAVQETRV
jgi:dTDP-4-dehydrorhamnose reductase